MPAREDPFGSGPPSGIPFSVLPETNRDSSCRLSGKRGTMHDSKAAVAHRRAPIWAYFERNSLRAVAQPESIALRSRTGTKTKCLKIGHFLRFPQVDSCLSKVASSHSVAVQCFL